MCHSFGDRVHLGHQSLFLAKDKQTPFWSSAKTQHSSESKEVSKPRLLRKLKLPKSGSGAWPNGFVAELDDSEELDHKLANYFQSMVGILQWIVELGYHDTSISHGSASASTS